MSNIDTQEIAKFDALGSRWWDRNGEFKALHDINPLRVDFIQQYVSLADKSVLDVGCGGGILSEALAQQKACVTGIDMSEAAIDTAKLHLLESGCQVDYHAMTAESLAEQQLGQYDVLTCMELLEHVPDPQQLVATCASLVKSGGRLFFSTLNRNPKAYLFAILGAEYVLNLVPKGTHDYAKFIRPSELEKWGREAGLAATAIVGLTYNPLSKHYRLSDDVSVNYLICCEKL